ncbi:MAG: helix-turn-helix transcriptional regulator [Bacillota bacterium]
MRAGEKLAQLIDAKGWSDAELARRLGEKRHWVTDRVTGRTAIKADEIPRIAAALGVSPCAFFEEVKPAPQVVRLETESAQEIGDAVAQRIVAEVAGLRLELTAVVDRAVDIAVERLESRLAAMESHLQRLGRIQRAEPEPARGVGEAQGEAIRGEPALREEKPPFGTEEYKRYQAMKMTARLTRMFADLPPEEQDFVWAMVEERRRLREHAEEPEEERQV